MSRNENLERCCQTGCLAVETALEVIEHKVERTELLDPKTLAEGCRPVEHQVCRHAEAQPGFA
jgi:hypothetical protein